jgi:hypothetical protein
MDALPVFFDGMSNGNLVAREEFVITVAGRASVRQVLLGNPRSRVISHANDVNRAMTARAFRRIGIARLLCLPVDAFVKLFYFIGVTLRALGRRELRGRSDFVHVPVTRKAGSISEHAVGALGLA